MLLISLYFPCGSPRGATGDGHFFPNHAPIFTLLISINVNDMMSVSEFAVSAPLPFLREGQGEGG
jgi:hypothetical protein